MILLDALYKPLHLNQGEDRNESAMETEAISPNDLDPDEYQEDQAKRNSQVELVMKFVLAINDYGINKYHGLE